MKRILTIFLFFLSCTAILAQSFSFRPSATLIGEAPFNEYISFKIDMVKSSLSPMTLKWIKLEETFPAGWDYNLCDHGGCYTGIPDSGTMIPLYDTTSGFLKINLNPRYVQATAVARFYVWDTKHPEQGMETLFEITSSEVTAITESISAKAFSFYPNPAQNFIEITSHSKDNGHVEIISLTGAKVLETYIHPLSRINLDLIPLQRGIYFIKFEDKSGKALTQKLIVK